MDRLMTKFILAVFVLLTLTQVAAHCQVHEDARRLPPSRDDMQRQWVASPAPTVRVAEAPRVSLDLPDTCRRLIAREGTDEDGHLTVRVGKEGSPWLHNGQDRWRRQLELRETIRTVARTMGADDLAAEMIWRKAIYESSGDASNVHIMSPDVDANRAAAAKGRRRSSERWKHARVPVYRWRRGELLAWGSHDAWALGRGLYGQVTGLHLHRWGDDVPPWSLCDPIVATVTVIWSMRAGLAECHGSTLRDAYRRFSSGKCAIREDRLEGRFDSLARGHVRGLRLDRIDPDAPAVLGDSWAEETADREVLLAVLRVRVE